MPERTAKRPAPSSAPALLALAFALFPAIAHAQLYSWKDAQGNVTIKNSPPPWYSESERPRGPRVQVLRNGKVVDDTAWPLDKRQEGRSQAARQEEARARSQTSPPGRKDADD
ncbi:MAG: DUF4124 domain-containing protein [Proteobacteria bacterium]|nr:DUF4124 domain-containing protein [Pseudomonadota bacterium]